MHKEKGPSRQKVDSHSLSAVTNKVTTPCKLVEDAMCSSLDDTWASPSTGSSCLFHYQPMTETPDLDELPKVTNTSQKLYILNILKL